MLPLIKGEAYPRYKNGLPVFAHLKNKLIPKRLKTNFVV
jgi:6-phosphofructokinase 1